MIHPTCKTCRFFVRDDASYAIYEGSGTCRIRSMPVVPVRHEGFWCGEHEPIVPEGAKPHDFALSGHGGSDVTEPLDEANAVIGAIVALLVEKGVFTFQEYQTQVARALAIADQDHAEDIS